MPARLEPEAERLRHMTPEQRASDEYYRSIGHPEYAGKYAAPNLPQGAKVRSVREETMARATNAPRQMGGRETGEAVTGGKLIFGVEVPGKSSKAAGFGDYKRNPPRMIRPVRSGFGPSVGFWDPETGRQSEVIGYDPATGEQVLAEVTYDGKGPSPAEGRALLGMTATSVVAAPFAAPKLLLFEAGGVAVGEGLKYGATGQHLTGEEAVYSAGTGLLVGSTTLAVGRGVNQKYIQPRVERSLTASYEAQQRANVDALKTGYDPWEVPETKLWRPTGPQRLAMKITGARVNFHMATQEVAASSYSNSAQFMGGIARNGDAFDFAISPKSSFLGLNKGELPIRPSASTGSRLPVAPVMQAWKEFKQDLKTVELNEELRLRAAEKGIPESQLAYDYEGPLSFDNYPVKLGYAKGKTVPAAWRGPFQETRGTRTGMKPIWESQGAKPQTGRGSSSVASYGEGYSVALKNVQRASGISFTTQTGRARAIFDVEDLVLKYPKSGLAHPPILAPPSVITRQILKDRQQTGLFSGSALSVGLLGLQVPAVASRQTPGQIYRQDTVQAQELDLDVPQWTGEVSRHKQPVPPLGFPTAPAASGFWPGGAKYEGGGFSVPGIKRRRGLRSKKLVDPILTAEEFLLGRRRRR